MEKATHVAIPTKGTPRFLLPIRTAQASAAAVRGYTTPSTLLARCVLWAATSAARVGATALAPGRISLGAAGTFPHHVLERFEDGAVFSVHLGPPRANRKPVLHVMDPRGRSLAYVKLGINPLTCQRVRAEASALTSLSAREIPGMVTPQLIDSGQWQGLDYLVMHPVHSGPAVAPSMAARGGANDGLVGAFATTMIPIVDAPWWCRAIELLDGMPSDGDAVRLKNASDLIQKRFGQAALLHGAGHGDWSPWNMSLHEQGALAVWDWERFTTDLPVGWDALHYHVASYPDDPVSGLRSVRHRLGEVLGTRVSSHEAEAILASYLLHRGVAFVSDRQGSAGAPNGPLANWLLPSLESLLASSN